MKTVRLESRWQPCALVLLLTLPNLAAAQCSVVTVTRYMSATPASYYNIVKVMLNGSHACRNVMGSASQCAPGPTMVRMTLTASANPTAYPSASCQWDCGVGCESVTVDGSDGLPVELLDLSVDE